MKSGKKRRPAGRSDAQNAIVATSRAWRVMISAVLVVAGILFLLPVVWVVISSLELPTDQFLVPPDWFPSHLTLASYRTLFSAAPFLLNIINSVIVTTSVVVGAAIVSILAAYAFARIEFRGREVLFIMFLAALTLPSQAVAVPASRSGICTFSTTRPASSSQR
jgi:multiple sugar transport system permease protein